MTGWIDEVEIIAYAVGVTVLLLGLLFSIGLHELGHLLPAKKFGVRVTKYMIGFGPTLFSRMRGDTEYGLKLIPLGGYIAMKGMVPSDENGQSESEPEYEAAEHNDGIPFYSLSPAKRVVIMMGGPVVNLILGLLFFGGAAAGIGLPAVAIAQVSGCVPASLTANCAAGAPTAPAASAGLKKGDIIQTIDGKDITDWSDVTHIVENSAGKQIHISILRDGAPELVTVTIATTVRQTGSSRTSSMQHVGFLGISPSTVLLRRSPVFAFNLAYNNITEAASLVSQLPSKTIDVVSAAIHSQPRKATDPISVVGLGQVAGGVASSQSISTPVKVSLFLTTLGSLNIGLFVLNMVPLLPLDGGQVVLALWQEIRDRCRRLLNRRPMGPIDPRRLIPLSMIVVLLVAGMGAALMITDFINPVL